MQPREQRVTIRWVCLDNATKSTRERLVRKPASVWAHKWVCPISLLMKWLCKVAQL